MKIITADKHWDINKLYELLATKLNALFKQQRQEDIVFNIEKNDGHILISKPELYEGTLFDIELKGNELYISKSEHYVDDVNQLTLQNILETLQMQAQDGNDIIYISGE